MIETDHPWWIKKTQSSYHRFYSKEIINCKLSQNIGALGIADYIHDRQPGRQKTNENYWEDTIKSRLVT